jgi:putative glutamine amidotransferase
MNLLTALKRLALGLAAALALTAATPERYLDQARPTGDGPRLVAFNPTVYNIRCLAALRSQNILAVPDLSVIGVYHVRQKEDFEASKRYVAENHLDWIRFHAISAEITEPAVFRSNACTPEFEAILAKSDGVVFFGGSDIPASLFHQKHNLLSDVEDPFRNYLELSAIFHFLGGSQDPRHQALLAARPKFAVLGICLGFQSLNVGTGGDLVQDIWTGIYKKPSVEEVIALGPEQWHNNPYKRIFPVDKLMPYNFHTLQLKATGKLAGMGFGPKDHPRVLSSHHQALGRLGQGWRTLATSRDGKVVEAMEHQRFPNVLGVQFHPEHYLLWDETLRIRQRPGDEPTSYHAILAGTPGSLDFNKAIWKWFGDRLLESRGR